MIHEKHESWLIEQKALEKSLEEVPVLVLECNKEFENDVVEQQKHMQKISEFFKIPLKQNCIRENNPSICL